MYDQTAAQVLEFHRSMLIDKQRMQAYLSAILQTVRPGDLVLDIGSGTGILAYFACLAGARHVYAVEQGPVIELARSISWRNGYHDRVTFLRDWSTHVELPEPVDIVITETIGNAGFEEGILGWIADARERLLSSQGKVIPHAIDLMAAPVQSAFDYASVADWSSNVFSLDVTPGRALAANTLIYTQLAPNSLLSEPAMLDRVVLSRATSNRTRTGGAATFTVSRDGLLHGLGCWFRAELIPGLEVTNHPADGAPSWNHILLPLNSPVPVAQGQRLDVEVHTSDNAAHWHWLVRGLDRTNGQKPAPETFIHSTRAAQLAAASPLLLDKALPRRSAEADIDLFILQQLDGHTPVREIAVRLAARFPMQVTSLEQAVDHIRSVLDYYGCSPATMEPGAQPAGRPAPNQTWR